MVRFNGRTWRAVGVALGCLLLLVAPQTPLLVSAFTSQNRISFIQRPVVRISASSYRIQKQQSSAFSRVAHKGTLVATAKPGQPLHQLSNASNEKQKDDTFDIRTTFALVGGQSLLIAVAAGAAILIGTPNFGFGPGVSFDWPSIRLGSLLALPLGFFAAALDLIEDRFPALQDVTKATQRSVLALLGAAWKPRIALVTAMALGIAAGFGEEMLFRGILQFELGSRFGSVIAVGISSIIFGALHAVTPMYAALATIASCYFGLVYIMTSNLAVPIACHAVYDVGALLFAHWTVSKLTDSERKAIVMWEGPK